MTRFGRSCAEKVQKLQELQGLQDLHNHSGLSATMEPHHMFPRDAIHNTSATSVTDEDQQRQTLHGQHVAYPTTIMDLTERRPSTRSFSSDAVLPPTALLLKPFEPREPAPTLPRWPPPPSYPSTFDIVSPERPPTELPPIQSPRGGKYDQRNNVLPPLSSLTAAAPCLHAGPISTRGEPSQHKHSFASGASFTGFANPTPSPLPPTPIASHWPSSNPLSAYYSGSYARSVGSPMRMDLESASNSVASADSPQRFQSEGSASRVSLDDPQVRLAVEALEDLRADFLSTAPGGDVPPTSTSQARPEEPLLSLLTTQHPVLGQVIEGTTSAYNASKNYSATFKTGAEYVEGYVAPVVNTVGSVGRVTGVEGGVRWFLGGGGTRKSQSSYMEANEQGSTKRRRVDGGPNFGDADEYMSGMDTPRAAYAFGDRRMSVASTVDTLPAYDDNRSPAYTEKTEQQQRRHPVWQSRLIMSTSGLSIAMSEESLRSLKYCLGWLRWANDHIGVVVNSLKANLEKYCRPRSSTDEDEAASSSSSHAPGETKHELAAKITALRAEVLKTLQDVIATVSKYAGGALPDNARVLVRRHLTSLPQRFRVAVGPRPVAPPPPDLSAAEAGVAQEKQTRESAQRVLVLAKEGLDMMAQVSGVLDGTIVSAEEWCERLGRRKREQRQALLDRSDGVSRAPTGEAAQKS